ncbi:MAG: hypothetical protein QM621_00830 [Aeromicrobium sp.]|uniref:hypothetical protein n=1 Tax=Aeromicrobium sp. TaxID=1871063 RepID=UPI0039E66612
MVVEMGKHSITMPAALSDEVRGRVGRGEFSAYVANAVRRQLERDALADLLAEAEAAHGPTSEADVEALVSRLSQ